YCDGRTFLSGCINIKPLTGPTVRGFSTQRNDSLRNIITLMFCMYNCDSSQSRQIIKVKIILSKEVIMDGFEINCKKTGSERISLAVLPIP
ncbi:hypothetical protein ACFZLN_005184, partial [Escherichia coli]